MSKSIRVLVPLYKKDADGIWMPFFKSKRMTSENVKFYSSWQHKLTKVTVTSISFLMFLSERMDGHSNEVIITKSLITKYLDFRDRCGIKACSESVVRKAVRQLKEHDLLISTPHEALYIVNPRCLYKSSERSRLKCLNSLSWKLQHDTGWGSTNLMEALFTTK